MVDVGRPTFADCLTWVRVLQGEFASGGEQSFDKQVRNERDLYYQKFKLETPAGRMAVRTGSAPADADAARDSLVPADVTIKTRPRRSREKYRKQAQILQTAGKAILHEWRRKKDPLNFIAYDMVLSRVGVARVLFDDRYWPKRPDDELSEEDADDWDVQNRARFPIVFERRPPECCYWRELDDGTIAVMVENYQATVLEARIAFADYPIAQRILKGREPNDPVRIYDVWIGRYRCQMIEEEPIYSGDGAGSGTYKGVALHGYPTIPYILFPFRELGFASPGDRYRGMLTNAAGLYPMESQVLSMYVHMLAWNAWKTWIGWTSDGRDLEIVPGQFLQVDRRKQEYIEMLKGEPSSPELLQFGSVVDSYIARNSVSGGPRTNENARSAQQVYAQISQRQQKVEPAKQAEQNGLARALSLALQIIEKMIDEPVTLPVPGYDRDGEPLGEITIKPTDIDGYWDCYEVKFGARIDPATLEMAKTLMSFSQNNWMPLRTSIEMSGLTDNPQEWIDELLEQAVDRLPPIIEVAALEWAREFYGEDDPHYQVLAQKIMESKQQQQGQGAMPGAPGVPTGGSMQPGGGGMPRGAQGGGLGQALAQNMAPRHGRPGGRSRGPQGGMPGQSAPRR